MAWKTECSPCGDRTGFVKFPARFGGCRLVLLGRVTHPRLCPRSGPAPDFGHRGSARGAPRAGLGGHGQLLGRQHAPHPARGPVLLHGSPAPGAYIHSLIHLQCYEARPLFRAWHNPDGPQLGCPSANNPGGQPQNPTGESGAAPRRLSRSKAHDGCSCLFQGYRRLPALRPAR